LALPNFDKVVKILTILPKFLLKFGNKLNIAKILTTLLKKNGMVKNCIKVNMPFLFRYQPGSRMQRGRSGRTGETMSMANDFAGSRL
jgi:hypothetical protein